MLTYNFHKQWYFFIDTKEFVDSVNIFKVQITSKLAASFCLHAGISLASFTISRNLDIFFSVTNGTGEERIKEDEDHQRGRSSQVKEEDKANVCSSKEKTCRAGLILLWGQKAEEKTRRGDLWPLRWKQVGEGRIPFVLVLLLSTKNLFVINFLEFSMKNPNSVYWKSCTLFMSIIICQQVQILHCEVLTGSRFYPRFLTQCLGNRLVSGLVQISYLLCADPLDPPVLHTNLVLSWSVQGYCFPVSGTLLLSA